KATDYAAYVSDQVKITKYFELLASLRYDIFSTTYSDPPTRRWSSTRIWRAPQSVQLPLWRRRPPDAKVDHLRRLWQLLQPLGGARNAGERERGGARAGANPLDRSRCQGRRARRADQPAGRSVPHRED